METMQVKKRSGKVEHADGAHDDQVFSYLMALYVLYNGHNIMENWGIQRNTIKTDEDKEYEESLIESEGEAKETIDSEVFIEDMREDSEKLEDMLAKEFFEKNKRIKTHDQFMVEQEREDQRIFNMLLSSDPDARKAYDNKYNILSGNSSIDSGTTVLPDYAFSDMDEDDLKKQQIERSGNLFTMFMQL